MVPPPAPRRSQLVVLSALLQLVAVTFAAGGTPAGVDQYSVTYDSPSASSLGAMPLGNGRTSANTWVETSTGDLMLNLGLADALDENSNLLKLGLIRVRLQPALNTTGGRFNQTLVLSSATINIQDGNGVNLAVWVDASTSTVRISVTPGRGGSTPLSVLAALDHQRRLQSGIPVDAAAFGNGWGGASGSFCNPNGTVANFVGIFPDKLHTIPGAQAAVAWFHRNDPERSDMFGDALKQQGLAECGPTCWDMLTNRSFGAALVGDKSFHSVNATAISTTIGGSAQQQQGAAAASRSASGHGVSVPGTAELAISVASAQTDTEAIFTKQLEAAALSAEEALTPTEISAQRSAHEQWWTEFFNRSWVNVITPTPPPPPPPPTPPAGSKGYVRHDGYAGDQKKLMRKPGWAHNGESPGNCSAPFVAPAGSSAPLSPAASTCVQHAATMCDATPGCRSFALSHSWSDGYLPQLYTDGMPGDHVGDGWILFVNVTGMPPASPPPPPVSDGFLVSRQNILMRYMDVCSSGRIGGGMRKLPRACHFMLKTERLPRQARDKQRKSWGKEAVISGATREDYFALKYNGGILTSEPVPKEDYRAWGPGQWWQNLRLPYYAMMAEGGGDLFKPLLRWYLGILPLAKRRTALWFNETDAAGRCVKHTASSPAGFDFPCVCPEPVLANRRLWRENLKRNAVFNAETCAGKMCMALFSLRLQLNSALSCHLRKDTTAQHSAISLGR
jgi:hypothetical protein